MTASPAASIVFLVLLCLAYSINAADRPAEVYVATLGAGVSGLKQLSHANDSLLTTLKVYPVEDWWRTKADIETFLRERHDNQVKEDFVRLFQPGVDPAAWGMSARQWLLRIAELLQ